MEHVKATITKHDLSHGDFQVTARVSQEIKDLVYSGDNARDRKLTYIQRESLELIGMKIARILTGDNFDPDHWHDIAGYALLAEKEAKDAKAPKITQEDVDEIGRIVEEGFQEQLTQITSTQAIVTGLDRRRR